MVDEVVITSVAKFWLLVPAKWAKQQLSSGSSVTHFLNAIVSRSAVNKWLSQSLIPHYVPYLETSAKSGENILEIFHSLLRLCLTMSPKQKIFTNSPLHQASRNSADEECRDHKKGMLLQRPSSIRRPRTSSNLDNRAEQITSMMRNFSITRHASLRLSKRSRTENNGKEIDQSECQIS
ncbi:hypothetical protein M514_10530 [Trichuris suis]|uniref:Uncharacterized protein n=1 Tax=Trichuris suis TaxID=68888 RepID=A0A085N3E0_9BILA|nr:hypothetical protein M514_10530 [Trichuris suis]